MNQCDLIAATIHNKDPFKASKQLQLECWWQAFKFLFSRDIEERLQFISEILSDDECWEETQTISHIKLNRRLVARKMVHSHSSSGKVNPLTYYEKYQVACNCCLEEDIRALFEKIKEIQGINTEEPIPFMEFVNTLTEDVCCVTLVTYWTLIVSGYGSELKLEGNHVHVHGLYSAINQCGHVEAVEFFWNKIKYQPEDKLSFEQKHETFVSATVRACNSDILVDFCISQVNPNMYLEILKQDFSVNGIKGCLKALLDMRRFDLIKTLFDCLGPNDIPERIYAYLLMYLTYDQYPTHYTSEAVELFVHVYKKEGFDRHRDYALQKRQIDLSDIGSIVVQLVQQNYMDIVWDILDNTPPSKLKEFLMSPPARYIRCILEYQEEAESLRKLSTYSFKIQTLNRGNLVNPNTSPSETVIKAPTKK